MKVTTSTDRCCNYRLTVFALASAALLLVAVPPIQAQEQDARAMLKSMADYVSNQPQIELKFDSAIEVITPQLEKIQFTNSGGALLSRPASLHAYRSGGYSDVELYFDGKTVSVFDRVASTYAQFEGPETLDELLGALRDGHGVALPGADLLLSQSYEILGADILEAKYIGHGVIGGRVCEHLAFRNFDTDWQLWVETGEKPIPCKLVITSKTLNSAPQYSVTITEWNTDVSPAADAFIFTPPAGTQRLAADALMHLDELPPDSSSGGVQ